MSCTNVAFAKIVPNQDSTSDLYLSTFTGNPFASDSGYMMPNIGDNLKTFNATTATKIGGSITWPNEMTVAPASLFGAPGVLAAGGFLVPGRIEDLNGDGIPEIISAEYWGSALTIISTTDPSGSFVNSSNLVYNIIDSNIGHAFDVEIVDLNNDGKEDILVTNHQGTSDSPAGSVYAYEVPSDITAPASSWTKHTLATNFPVLQSGSNQAAPGAAHTFHPKVGSTTKPSIIVAGDGAQKAYLLEPNSEDLNDWNYTNWVLHDCVNTVGGINVGDVNGDGFVEIFVPCYDDGHLVAYSYGQV
ncbi:hypothetical protein HDU76_008186 [Blyttiomyces sp. JEL0837]|nr:hypothetical protein HDU76_008186 [Blyttiomyces sp. JEL0837]